MIYLKRYKSNSAIDKTVDEHTVGQMLLAHAIKKEYGFSYLDMKIIKNKWGKPMFRDYADIHFNISHNDIFAACIIDNKPVGIDIENIRPYSIHAARHVCSETELNEITSNENPEKTFFIIWTLKESCIKAMGVGFAASPKRINFEIKDNQIICESKPDYRFEVYEINNKHILTVCYNEKGDSFISRLTIQPEGVNHGRIYTI